MKQQESYKPSVKELSSLISEYAPYFHEHPAGENNSSAEILVKELKQEFPALVIPEKKTMWRAKMSCGLLELLNLPNVSMDSFFGLTREQNCVSATGLLHVYNIGTQYQFQDAVTVLVEEAHALSRCALRPQQLVVSKTPVHDINFGDIPAGVALRCEWQCYSKENLAGVISAFNNVPGPYYRPSPQEVADIVKKESGEWLRVSAPLEDHRVQFSGKFKVREGDVRESGVVNVTYMTSHHIITVDFLDRETSRTDGFPLKEWMSIRRSLKERYFGIWENDSSLFGYDSPKVLSAWKTLMSPTDTMHSFRDLESMTRRR